MSILFSYSGPYTVPFLNAEFEADVAPDLYLSAADNQKQSQYNISGLKSVAVLIDVSVC